ncbi:MAG: hypothetical protein M1817_004814 [Caeruleum heppii]|nr:MAG: hypothetical protein M1817_004814 [Caeruleum heppii]
MQDVERCMPENDYFRQEKTQQMLLDSLFIFCKLNQDVGYRQGMHELLAPILWVLEEDAIEPSSSETTEMNDDQLLHSLLDLKYMEADAFTLFALVMQSAKSFYELGDSNQEAAASAKPAEPASSSQQKSPIVQRSRRIHQDYLTLVDPELSRRLSDIDVLPQVFLIRWIRLLFGREFPFAQLLEVWDVLFAEDPGLELVDYICVAMLLRVRWQLMEADYSGALTLLLRYPSPDSPDGPSTFVQDAIYLRDHLDIFGGIHIIQKYSSRVPTPLSDLPSQSATETQTGKSSNSTRPHRTRSPLLSPSRFLQQQGKIEDILHGAARGVYSRGEKWGVTQAVREAVGEVRKNLQAANSSPQRRAGVGGGRWSLDEGHHVEPSAAEVVERLASVQARNKELAKMLEDAVKRLRPKLQRDTTETMQRQGQTDGAEDESTRILVELQLIQACLENPAIPLPKEEMMTSAVDEGGPGVSDLPVGKSTTLNGPSSPRSSSKNDSPAPVTPPLKPSQASPPAQAPLPTTPTTPKTPLASPSRAATSTEDDTTSVFHRPRSSLAQSSFSWMLGDDEPRSGFVASFPTPATERRGSRVHTGKQGFLFGDDVGDQGAGGGHDEGGFSMGTLRGGKGKLG